MAKKTYDDHVKEWWTNKFSNTRPMSINSFFENLREGNVQMISLGTSYLGNYQIFKVIEGDILLVKFSTGEYCVLYPRHKTFIRLIFPFEESYKKEMFKYTEDKL